MRRECRERFPRHRVQRKRLVSYPGMHRGTCVTHVPWCMSGSLIHGGGENVPGIPSAYATRNFTYLARGPWHGTLSILQLCYRSYRWLHCILHFRFWFHAWPKLFNPGPWVAKENSHIPIVYSHCHFPHKGAIFGWLTVPCFHDQYCCTMLSFAHKFARTVTYKCSTQHMPLFHEQILNNG